MSAKWQAITHILVALMYWRQQSPRRWETQICSQKITDMSYETDYLTCKSREWFRTVTVLVCPRFWAPACVAQCARVFVWACVCVGACWGMWMTGCQRKGCHYLADVGASCVQGQGHITSSELTLCGQETLLYDFPTRGKHSCQSQCSHHPTTQSHFEVFPPWFTKKKSRIFTTIIWKRPPEPFISCFFSTGTIFLKLIHLLCSEGLGEGSVFPPSPPPSCPYPLTSSV